MSYSCVLLYVLFRKKKIGSSHAHFLPRYLSKKVSGDTGQKVTACMLKTFNRMKKRIGFLIYQFVLPALQVRRW